MEPGEQSHTLRITDGSNSVTANASATTAGDVVLFTAPSIDTTSLDASVCEELREACLHRPDAVVVRDGTALSRALAAEYVRFTVGIPVIVLDQHDAVRVRRAVDERDNAATMILSGRADAIAYEPDSLTPGLESELAQAFR
jgi:anthraniloyl-CoA monooxygenase